MNLRFNFNTGKFHPDDIKQAKEELTKKLDSLNSDFNQEILNEIILWKVNRYAKFDEETINLSK